MSRERELIEENERLKKENELLTARVAELEAQLAVRSKPQKYDAPPETKNK